MTGKRGSKQSFSSSCFDFDEVDPDEAPQQPSREPKLKRAKKTSVPEPAQRKTENDGEALKNSTITKQSKGARSKKGKVNGSRASSTPYSAFDFTEIDSDKEPNRPSTDQRKPGRNRGSAVTTTPGPSNADSDEPDTSPRRSKRVVPKLGLAKKAAAPVPMFNAGTSSKNPVATLDITPTGSAGPTAESKAAQAKGRNIPKRLAHKHDEGRGQSKPSRMRPMGNRGSKLPRTAQSDLALDDVRYHLQSLGKAQKLASKRHAAIQVVNLLAQAEVCTVLRQHNNCIPAILKHMLNAGAEEDHLYCCTLISAIALIAVEHKNREFILEVHVKLLLYVIKRPTTLSDDDADSSYWDDLRKSFREKKTLMTEGLLEESEEFPIKRVALEALRLATEHNDLLQEPVRRIGGLEDLALRVKACASSLQKNTRVLDSFRELEAIGRILENVTFRNSTNVEQLVHHIELMEPVMKTMEQCKKALSQPCFEVDEASTHSAALECLTSMLRVLVNLTNEYSPGCEAFGRLGGLFIAAECLVLFGTEQYDALVLALGLLVNATEHSQYHRLQIRGIVFKRKVTKSRTGDTQVITALQTICQLFGALIQQRSKTGTPRAALSSLDFGLCSPRASGGTAVALSDALMSYSAILLGILAQEPDNHADIREVLGPEIDDKVSGILRQFLKDHEEAGILSEEVEESITNVLDALEKAK